MLMAMFFFLMAVVVIVVMAVFTAVPMIAVRVAVNVRMSQQAVAVLLPAVGQAEEATRPNEAAAQAIAVGVVVGADLLTGGTRNFIFIRLALDALDAHRKVASPGGESKHAGAFVRHAVGAHFQLAFVAFFQIGRASCRE